MPSKKKTALGAWTRRYAKPLYGGYKEPERWHPIGCRAGVGAMVFVREDLELGAKAIHGPHGGGRYSAWIGIVQKKGKRRGKTD